MSTRRRRFALTFVRFIGLLADFLLALYSFRAFAFPVWENTVARRENHDVASTSSRRAGVGATVCASAFLAIRDFGLGRPRDSKNHARSRAIISTARTRPIFRRVLCPNKVRHRVGARDPRSRPSLRIRVRALFAQTRRRHDVFAHTRRARVTRRISTTCFPRTSNNNNVAISWTGRRKKKKTKNVYGEKKNEFARRAPYTRSVDCCVETLTLSCRRTRRVFSVRTRLIFPASAHPKPKAGNP